MTVGCFIRSSDALGRRHSPRSARPSPRLNLAQRSWSATDETMPPLGVVRVQAERFLAAIRCREASYSTAVAAFAAFSELAEPVIGMLTV